MSKCESYLGIARKAGLLVTGEVNAGIEAKTGRACLVAVASDASDNALHRAEGFVVENGVNMTVVPLTKFELSSATGRPGCSMVAFTDIGLACSFVSALEQEYEGDYGALALALAQLKEKAERRDKIAGTRARSGKLGKRRNHA